VSHYYEKLKMDKTFKTWDNNPEEDNLEDRVLVLEQLENALIDNDDRVEMPPPSTAMVPLTKTPVAIVVASCSIPLPFASTQLPLPSAPLPPCGGSRNNRGGAKRKET
jgi:hypothetical protein